MDVVIFEVKTGDKTVRTGSLHKGFAYIFHFSIKACSQQRNTMFDDTT